MYSFIHKQIPDLKVIMLHTFCSLFSASESDLWGLLSVDCSGCTKTFEVHVPTVAWDRQTNQLQLTGVEILSYRVANVLAQGRNDCIFTPCLVGRLPEIFHSPNAPILDPDGNCP